MENIPVTTYRGFSAVSGETTFTQDMADIRNGKHAKLIIKIASLVAQGKVEEANHVKKQLPFRTLTANYRERRLAPSIPATTPSSRSTSTTWKRDSWSRPGPSSTKPRTPWAVSSPPKGTATSCSSSCRRNTPDVCMTVSDRAR